MPVRTDADLVRAAVAGDVASFEQLYANYVPVVHAILLGRLPPADADDVAQHVFINASTQLPALREPAAFAGWITRSARKAGEEQRRKMSETVGVKDSYVTHETQREDMEAA